MKALSAWATPAFACALLLTACAPSPMEQPASSPTPSNTSPIVDAEIARTCAAQAIIQTNVLNAREEFRNGLITEAQYVAVVNTAANDYKLMSIGSSWGLQELIRELTATTSSSESAPFGARFDPDGEYLSISADVATECTANGSPIALYATQGG